MLPAEDAAVQLALPIIKTSEGFSSKPYRCPAGYPTIGWGNRFYEDGREVTMADPPVTASRAEQILMHSVIGFASMLDQHLNVALRPGQFAALLSFLYNVGPGKAGATGKDGLFMLKNGNVSMMWKMVQRQDFVGAAGEFEKWTKGGGVVLGGLVKRRKAERALFEGKVGGAAA